MARKLHIAIGMAIWAVAIGAGWWALAGRGEQAVLSAGLRRQLWQYATGHRRVVDVRFQQMFDIRRGDPVFVIDTPQSARQVGEVADVWLTENRLFGRVLFYTSAPRIDASAHLTYHQTPQSIQWVLRTMLSDEKRRQIAALLARSYQQHREELLALLRPVVEDAFRDAVSVIEQDLPPALRRRRDQLERLSDKYQREILEKELVPLVREEIWPIVRARAEPVVTEVGREIWQQTSLWRFGWRFAYDRSPLPERNLLEKEWARFLREDVTPVLEAHTDDFIAVQEQIFADLSQNPRVRAVARQTLARIASDPEARRIAWEVLQEVVVNNPRLRAVLEKHWRSPKAQAAVHMAAARMEPTVVHIGELLLGTPRGGITPEFARVLRSQILLKDRRWLVLETGASGGGRRGSERQVLVVSAGDPNAPNPFVRTIDPPLTKRGRDAAQRRP